MSQANAEQIQAGSILYSSWGYEQTNVDFYRVEKMSESFLTLQQISDEYEADGDMTGRSKPAADPEPIGKPIRRKLHRHPGGAFVQLNSYSYAYPWDGHPKRVSSYA